MVNLSHEAGMNTVVTVDDLSGSGGVFKFNTELDSEANGDKLVINYFGNRQTHIMCMLMTEFDQWRGFR